MASKSFADFLQTQVWPDITNRTAYTKYKLQLKILLGLVIVALIVGTISWWLFGPIKPEASRERRQAAKICAESVRETLRQNRGEYRTAKCMPFVGDSTDALFYSVFETLSTSGTFDLKGISPPNRIRRFFGLSLAASNDARVAARKARRAGADVAICGAVRQFETTPEGVDIVLEFRLIDAATGTETFSGRYSSREDREAAKSAAENAGTLNVPLGAGQSAGKTTVFKDNVEGRLMVSDEVRSEFFGACWWTLAALAIPILAFPFLEGAAAKRSNTANFFALLSCFVADALCAWIFVTPTFQDWLSWLGVVVMAIVALWYDVQVLHLAHRRTEPLPAATV